MEINGPVLLASSSPPPQADTNNHLLRRLDLNIGRVLTVAGSPSQASGFADGLGSVSSFFKPAGLAMDSSGTFVIIVRC